MRLSSMNGPISPQKRVDSDAVRNNSYSGPSITSLQSSKRDVASVFARSLGADRGAELGWLIKEKTKKQKQSSFRGFSCDHRYNSLTCTHARACLFANYLKIRAFVFTSSLCDVKHKDPRVAAATAAAAGVYPLASSSPRPPPQLLQPAGANTHAPPLGASTHGLD